MQGLLAWWIFKVRGWKIEGGFPFELKKNNIGRSAPYPLSRLFSRSSNS